MAKGFPKTLGACVDLAYEMRAKRLEFQREMEEKLESLKSNERAINDHILNTFTKAQIEGAKGQVASASMTPHIYPKPVDWDKLYAFIKKTGSFDLLERRVSKSAFRDRYEAKEAIPGVEAFVVNELSLTKVR